MNDKEFALEVIRDYFDEMRAYVQRAIEKKGKIKVRHWSKYQSKRGNRWVLFYRPDHKGRAGICVKRPQPGNWFSWYSIMELPEGITLFGFNKHVAERISQRYSPELTPTGSLMNMLLSTPAIIQSDAGDNFYTRINGGICLGPAYGKRVYINTGGIMPLPVDLRETSTFISDDMLYDNQRDITNESILRAIAMLGDNFLPDDDKNNS